MSSDLHDLFASIPISHHATLQERAEQLRRRPGRRSRKPECVIIGHAWADDKNRAGWLFCVACEGVKPS